MNVVRKCSHDMNYFSQINQRLQICTTPIPMSGSAIRENMKAFRQISTLIIALFAQYCCHVYFCSLQRECKVCESKYFSPRIFANFQVADGPLENGGCVRSVTFEHEGKKNMILLYFFLKHYSFFNNIVTKRLTSLQ